jgi:ComF family protein
LYYNKQGLGQKLVAAIKYQGNIALGEWIGASLAEELLSSGFFEGIDYLIPVPLHKKKQWKRGFNQSETLAKGISAITGIPIDRNNLYRAKANVSQTRKGTYERWKNTLNIFQVRDVNSFKNKHLLLLDDVLTTGSTLEACARALLQCENARLSVLTLAIA